MTTPKTYTFEALTEFNAPAGGSPNSTPTAPAPTPAPAHPGAGFLTQAEHEAQLAAARKAEKDKLYKALEGEKARVKELEAKAAAQEEARVAAERAAMEPMQRYQAELEAMRAQLTTQQEETRALILRGEQERQQNALRLHREQILRSVDAYGNLLVDPTVAYLVQGNTIEEINASVPLAQAEFQHLHATFAARFGYNPHAPMAPQQPTPHPMSAGQQPAQVEQQVTVPTVTQPPPLQGPSGMGVADISAMTTHDMIRSGAYGKNREAILASMKQTNLPGAVQLPMRPLVSPVAPQQPQQQYPQHQQMPHQPQPFGQQQPHGLPTPPVQPPQMAQVPGQPAPNDPRALAAAAAHAALANPGAVSAAGFTSAPAPHSEYQAPPPGATVPTQHQLGNGQNPMMR